jgi:hypothetical protein
VDANLSKAAPLQPPEADREKIERKAFFYCLELIQLIENVWGDLRLYEEGNRKNPKNGGWLNIFRFWARQPIFRSTWERAAYTFDPLFQQFFISIQAQEVRKEKPDCAPLPT